MKTRIEVSGILIHPTMKNIVLITPIKDAKNPSFLNLHSYYSENVALYQIACKQGDTPVFYAKTLSKNDCLFD